MTDMMLATSWPDAALGISFLILTGLIAWLTLR